MRGASNILTPAFRHDLIAGGVAGLIGGLVFWWALAAQGMAPDVPGLLGLHLLGAGVILHLLSSVLVGASFGAVLRYQPSGYAGTTSSGLLLGLLWWVAGPMSLGPLLEGAGPTWSIVEAQKVFPSLIGHLLYGGVTGLGFYIFVASYLHFRPRSEDLIPLPEVPKTRVLILGGGFGGIGTAQRLERLYSRVPGVEITLVSQSNYLLYTPMLAEVASSALEPQHISAPVRASCPHTRFHRGEVVDINTKDQVVRVRSGGSVPYEDLTYDRLVLALGSVANYFDLPGMAENLFKLKTLEDATRLRNHIIGLLEDVDVEPFDEERVSRLTFAVAGGGFAGIEAIAELFDMVHSVLHFYPTIQPPQLRFVLIHSRDRILPELGAQLGDYALRKLQARGIEFMLENRVTGAVPGAVLLGNGEILSTHTLVWTAGNQPNPLLKTLPCEKNRAGAVVVDGTLLVDGLTNVWAVGDCAQIPDPYNDGRPYPPTAQHALREGKVAAENIAAVIQGKPVKQFRFRAIGVLVGLGHRTAAAEIRGWRFSGLLAWLMWRTIYLSKLPGAEKKVRVALDWTIDLFFPRDIVVTSSLERNPILDGNPVPPASQEQPPDNGNDRTNAGDGTAGDGAE